MTGNPFGTGNCPHVWNADTCEACDSEGDGQTVVRSLDEARRDGFAYEMRKVGRMLYTETTPATSGEDVDPMAVQVGGDHYSRLAIQPMEYSHRNRLGANEHLVIRYITRWRNKGGLQDLEKAADVITKMLDLERRFPTLESKP